jgi:hypothetical protein
MLSDMATALVPITTAAWKTAQHFSYGARGFYARPSERSERLKLLVRRRSHLLTNLPHELLPVIGDVYY